MEERVKKQTMGPVQEYWRDRMMATVKWGTTIWLVVIGWLVLNTAKFSVSSQDQSETTSTVVMLVLVPLCGTVWSSALYVIYAKWLTGSVDETVLPRKIVVGYAIGWTIVVTAVTIAVAVI